MLALYTRVPGDHAEPVGTPVYRVAAGVKVCVANGSGSGDVSTSLSSKSNMLLDIVKFTFTHRV